jgi:hypothetical protein
MFGMPNDELPEEERLLYKATEFDILDTTESPVVEVADRYKTLLDIQGYDDEAMRVFSNKNNATEAPKLNFEGISAASIRRIKKFYNLANRSGATSKNMVGLKLSSIQE